MGGIPLFQLWPELGCPNWYIGLPNGLNLSLSYLFLAYLSYITSYLFLLSLVNTIVATLIKYVPMIPLNIFLNISGCKITVRHATCPTNLAQSSIEEQFLLLNVLTVFVENLFVVKPWLNQNRVTKAGLQKLGVISWVHIYHAARTSIRS